MRILPIALAVALLVRNVPEIAATQMDGLHELSWDLIDSSSVHNCPPGYHCAELEFCQEGNDVYGYRVPGPFNTCGDIAPLITMEAGKNYYLLLHNTSPEEPANIHTHGLHISGAGNSDDITRRAGPGECLAYYWEIPSDHMGGTFWYHAHVHSYTKDHVEGGAFGMLLIDAPITHDGDTEVDVWLSTDNELLLIAARMGNTGYGNGMENGPTFNIKKDGWYRLRVVTVDSDAAPQEFIIPDACEAHAVAHDGVWRFNIPKIDNSHLYMLTGASRIDLAIKCTSQGSFDIYFGGENDDDAVATLDVSNGPTSDASPWKDGVQGQTWSVDRPQYLQDLINSGNPGQEIAIQLTGGNVNAEFEGNDVGHEWDPDLPIAELAYDKLTDLTIGARNHPFHLHVYHMQIVGYWDNDQLIQGGCGGIYDEGEYFDVVSPEVDDCVVRFRTMDVGDRVVFHCHILQHEDNGAMGWLDVKGGPAPGSDQVNAMSCGSGGPAPSSPGPSPGGCSDLSDGDCKNVEENSGDCRFVKCKKNGPIPCGCLDA